MDTPTPPADPSLGEQSTMASLPGVTLSIGALREIIKHDSLKDFPQLLEALIARAAPKPKIPQQPVRLDQYVFPTPKNLTMTMKEEIEAFTYPYTLRQEKPPFSVDELAIMTGLCSEVALQAGHVVFPREDVLTFVQRFPYYNSLAQAYAYDAACHGEGLDIGDPSVNRQRGNMWDMFALGIRSYGTPSVPSDSRLPLWFEGYWPEEGQDDLKFVLPSKGEARCFLRRWLDTKCVGPFRLMDLPPEIRTMIYEMVFYHADALECSAKWARKKDHYILQASFQSKTREELIDHTLDEWDDLSHVKPHDLCQLLSVSKQIYNEAAKVFCHVNTFYCGDLRSLGVLLSQCRPEKRAYFRDITFSYSISHRCTDDQEDAEAICKMLSKLEHLDCLRLLLEDRECEYLNDRLDLEHETDVEKIFQKLRDLKHLYERLRGVRKFEMLGDWPEALVTAMKREVTKPVPEKDESEVS